MLPVYVCLLHGVVDVDTHSVIEWSYLGECVRSVFIVWYLSSPCSLPMCLSVCLCVLVCVYQIPEL